MTIDRQLCAFPLAWAGWMRRICGDVGANVFALGGKVWNEG